MLIDQKRFRRDKVCGDFVGPVALNELKALGVTRLADYHRANVVRDAALYLDGRELIVRSLPAVHGLPTFGPVVPRIKFDGRIVQAARDAGAHMCEGKRSRDMCPARDSLRLPSSDPVCQRAPSATRHSPAPSGLQP
jgi:flavin-dependent dehydrogenase